MEGSALKLIVEKGPREGETLGCKSKSVIRIGRLVKGNTFAIKDAGISSKHLVIELKEGNWVVSDLGTSNGTLLNGLAVQPNRDHDLRDEDVIKIGEYTSLKVKIEGSDPVKEKPGVGVEVAEDGGDNRLRRNPRRGAGSRRVGVGDLKGESSDSALIASTEVQNTETLVSVAESLPRRRGRATRAKALSQERSREIENFGPVEEKKKVRPRRKVGVAKDELEKITEESNMGGEDRGEADGMVGAGMDREQENNDQVLKEIVVSQNEGLQSVLSTDSKVLNSQKERTGETSASTSAGDDSRKIDLENMTLGEWFEYLEVYLPRQINETAEEIISSIRERSNQFNEFIKQQDSKVEFS